MSSAIVAIQDHPQFEQSDSEKLGDEITELCGYIYAATHHLLELIREFDDKNVSAVTPTAKWYAGEEMDWEHAVSLMC